MAVLLCKQILIVNLLGRKYREWCSWTFCFSSNRVFGWFATMGGEIVLFIYLNLKGFDK